jgi:cold shock protein
VDWRILRASLALAFRLVRAREVRRPKTALFPADECPGCAAAPFGPAAMRERSSPMATAGTVKFFNAERGYGFIKPDEGGRDVFVHVTAVERAGLKSLTEGQRISFDVEPDKKGKGPKAVNLVITT